MRLKAGRAEGEGMGSVKRCNGLATGKHVVRWANNVWLGWLGN